MPKDEHGFIIPDINGKRHFGVNGVDFKTVACGMVEGWNGGIMTADHNGHFGLGKRCHAQWV
jgi:uncharacterized Fe-S cluster-containing protein